MLCTHIWLHSIKPQTTTTVTTLLWKWVVIPSNQIEYGRGGGLCSSRPMIVATRNSFVARYREEFTTFNNNNGTR